MELTRYVSPLGTIFLAADNGALAGLWLEGQKYFAATLDEAALRELMEEMKRDGVPINGFLDRSSISITGQNITVEFDRPAPPQIDGETIPGVSSYRAAAHSQIPAKT